MTGIVAATPGFFGAGSGKSLMLNGATLGTDALAVGGNVSFQYSGGLTSSFLPYAFGIKYAQAGGTNDNVLEMYLGSTDTDQATLSVRHNGNNTGAQIQARNAADTDGIFIDFSDATAPFVRWGNAGPFLVKETTGALVMRNWNTPVEPQVLRIANTYTVGGVREYLSLGVTVANRFAVRTSGVGGGSQRPLDLDGSIITLGTGGTTRWQIDPNGRLQTGGTSSSFPAFIPNSTSIEVKLADNSAFTNIKGKLTTETSYGAGAPSPTGYLTLYDASGTAYKVPAEAV